MSSVKPIIICKCSEKNCSCIKEAKKYQYAKVIRNGKQIYPRIYPHMYSKEATLSRREFIFDGALNHFQYFDGYYLNQHFHELNRPYTRQELNSHLVSHQIYQQEQTTIYYTYLPSQIHTFSLKPYGYLNPNATPPNCVSSDSKKQKFSILVEGPSELSLAQSIRQITQEEFQKLNKKEV